MKPMQAICAALLAGFMMSDVAEAGFMEWLSATMGRTFAGLNPASLPVHGNHGGSDDSTLSTLPASSHTHRTVPARGEGLKSAGGPELATTFRDAMDRYVFEMAWIQDFSSSFNETLLSLRSEIPEVMSQVSEVFPDSRFALAGFVDKPLEPFGYEQSDDYCYRLKYPLTSSVDEIKRALEAAITHSGGDWPEAQLHALLGIAHDNDTLWTNFEKTDDHRTVKRVAFIMTGSGYHKAGDSGLAQNNYDGTEDCIGEDYPSVHQVKEALEEKKIIPVFLVEGYIAPIYMQLVHRLGDRGVVSVMRDNDPSEIRRAVARGIAAAISDKHCTSHSHTCCHKHCCGGGSCDKKAEVVIKLKHRPKKLRVEAEY